jgi:formylglycine-generating enzyme required for sulfatase activity
MTENPNQPREYDAVLGGESQLPLDAAVLGGIPGVKSRLSSPIVEVKIAALSEALKYGDAGLDLIIAALQDESMQVKFAAYSLLKDRNEPNLKELFQKYLPTFDFDVITVDAEGKENSRHRHYAHFFCEDLGNKVMLDMVYIPGGTFIMGSPPTEKGRYRDRESPQHQVTVSNFFVGKYPITQAQWQAVMGNNPSKFKGEKRPVENNILWEDTVEFCGKLSQKTGKKYRLLSEAEWEYACRAGTTTPFHFGETITQELVNYYGEEPYANAPKGVWSGQTTDVGSFPPNAFGLYDMHGNVWEWCSDMWNLNYQGAPTDGSSWDTGYDKLRVMRGGSWQYPAACCRSGYRLRGFLKSVDVSLRDIGGNWGFRVAVASVSPSS